MKVLIAFLVLLIANIASADICRVAIVDQYGYEYDNFIRSSYSTNAACDDATWDCRQKLSEYQSYGRLYNAICRIKEITPTYPSPSPYPNPYPYPYPAPTPYPYPTPNPPRYPSPAPYPRDPREPPRHDPGSEPRYPSPRPMPGPHPAPRPRLIDHSELE